MRMDQQKVVGRKLVAGRTVDDLPRRAARAVRHLLQRLALRLAQIIPREVGDRAVERLAREHPDASDEGGEGCRELNDEVGACGRQTTRGQTWYRVDGDKQLS